jgi:uncharacterized repeat protein (TIGR01451 family)
MRDSKPNKRASGRGNPCPVCGTENAPGTLECKECGFIFETQQGAAPAPEATAAGGATAPAATRECPSCMAVIEASDAECPICGEKLVPLMVKETGQEVTCKSCGAVLDSSLTICPICGEGLVDVKEGSVPEAQADEFTCNNCGSILTYGMTECPVCGVKFDQVMASASPAAGPVEAVDIPMEEPAVATASRDESWDDGAVGGQIGPITEPEASEPAIEEPMPAEPMAPISEEPVKEPAKAVLADDEFACPSCAVPVKMGTDRCESCWADVVGYVKCQSCGATSGPGVEVCNECFAKLPLAAAPAAVAPETELEVPEEKAAPAPKGGGAECPGCGSPVLEEDVMCADCGMVLIEDDEPPVKRREPRKKPIQQLGIWEKRAVIIVIALLLSSALMPFIFSLPAVERDRIVIDGSFGDWNAVVGSSDDVDVQANPNVDLQHTKVIVDTASTYFYLDVAGTMFGDAAGDTVRFFIDADQNPSTGYFIRGIGADYQVRVFGHGGLMTSAACLKFDETRPHNDFNGFASHSPAVPNMAPEGVEVRVPSESLGLVKDSPITVISYVGNSAGQQDFSDVPCSSFGAILGISQESTIPSSGIVTSSSSNVLLATLTATGGDVTVTSMSIPGSTANRTFPLVVANGTSVGVRFACQTSGLASGAFVHAELTSDMVQVTGGASVITGQGAFGYYGAAPAHIAIDGAFADWSSIAGETSDNASDVKSRTGTTMADPSLDIRAQNSVVDQSNLNIYVEVAGGIAAGSWIPEVEEQYVAPQTRADDDQTTQPPKTTTKQATTPQIVRPANRPVKTGEDLMRAYFDTDSNSATGYSIGSIGADRMLEVKGKDGRVTSSAFYRFDGTDKNAQSWALLSTVATSAAASGGMVEMSVAGSAFSGFTLVNSVVEIIDWRNNRDVSDLPMGDVLLTSIQKGTRDGWPSSYIKGRILDTTKNYLVGATTVATSLAQGHTTFISYLPTPANIGLANYDAYVSGANGQMVRVFATDGVNYGVNSTIQPSASTDVKMDISVGNSSTIQPKNLAISSLYPQNVARLSWTQTGATSVKIYRTTSNNCFGTFYGNRDYGTIVHEILPGDAMQYDDNKSIVDGVKYYYLVETVDGSGTSWFSTEAEFLADFKAPVIQHTNLTGGYTQFVKIDARVTDLKGVVSTTVYYRRLGAVPYSSSPLSMVSGSAQNGSWEGFITAPTAGEYQYYISASDGTAQSTWGNPGNPIPLNVAAAEDPYPIYGYVNLYNGNGGAYNPIQLANAAVQITWFNTSISAWSTISTTTIATGQYSIDILNYSDNGVVYCNATAPAPYGNRGYNWTTIMISDAPGGRQQNITCGVPYNVTITTPANGANVNEASPFPVSYRIVDRDNVLARGYYTFGDGAMRWRSSAVFGAPIPADYTFNGILTPTPGVWSGNLALMSIGPQWINISEIDSLGLNPYLTPWGSWNLSDGTPGYLKDWDNITVNVQAEPHIQLTKTAPVTINPGAVMMYRIDYINNGGVDAHDVWINETYPAGVAWLNSNPLPTTPNYAWSFPLIVAGASGTIFINVTVNGALSTGTVLNNIVTANYTNPAGTYLPESQAVANTTVIGPLVTLWKSGPTLANTGQYFNYTLTYRNNGTDWARNVVIRETYPSGVTFISSIPSPTFPPVVWMVGDMAPGAQNSIQICVRVNNNAAGLLVNTANATYANNYSAPQPVSWAWWNTTVSDPMMTLSKLAPASANSGETIMYTITFTNTGATAAHNVWINETYPVGTAYVDSSILPSFGTNRWLFPMIAPGATVTIFINVTIIPGVTGNLTNYVQCDYTDGQGEAQTRVTAQDSTLVADPVMQIAKAGPATANHGQTIMYTITVTNAGTATALSTWVNETYPPNVLFVDANPAPLIGNGTWWFPVIMAGNTETIFINVTIQANASSPLINNVRATYLDAAGTIRGPVTASWQTVLNDPAMELTKTAPAAANAGQTITYTITYRNSGTDTARNLVITESYPPGVTFISAVPAPSFGDNVWLIPNVTAGSSGTITISVTIGALVPSGTVLLNQVTLDYNNTVGIPQPQVTANATTVVDNPLMTIAKTAPATADPGQVITYRLTYHNSGSATAYNVGITETYPAGVTFVSSVPAPTVPFNNFWNIGNVLPGGWGNVTIQVRIDANFTGSLVNNVTLTYEDLAGLAQPPAYAEATTTVTVPLVTVWKEAPLYAAAGSVIMYTIHYANNGTDAATDLHITEIYPVGVTFLNANPMPTVGNNVWIIPFLAPGASGAIFVNVTISSTATGILRNFVRADFNNSVGVPQPGVIAPATTVLTGPYVVIAKAAPAVANSGEAFTYTITLTNLGNDTAQNVVVTETYPLWTSFVGSIPATSNPGTGDNIWTFAAILAGETVWINVTILVSNLATVGTHLPNFVQVYYENAASVPLPIESATADTVVVDPSVMITKTAPATAVTGEIITYTINYMIGGTDIAYNVWINETYPAGVTFVSAFPNPTNLGLGDNQWSLGDLPPGTMGTIMINVTVDTASGILLNTVLLEHGNGWRSMADAGASAQTLVLAPLMTVTKTAPANAAPGQLITYTITYSNIGTAAAFNVAIIDNYPAGVSFISSVPAPTIGNNIWIIPFLAAGGSGTIIITVQVDLTATGWLNNTGACAYNNSASFELPDVGFMAPPTRVVDCVVSLSKEGPAQVNTGQTFTYWLNYTNTGTDFAYNVVITETYPAGVTFVGALPAPVIPTNNVWNVGTIGPMGVGSIAITVFVNWNASGVLTNHATATAINGGGVAIPTLDAWYNTTVVDPALSVTKTGPATAVPGQAIMYTIVVGNAGTSPAYNVVVTETYPAGVTFLNANPNPSNLGFGDNIWNLGTIAAGSSVTIFINVTVSPTTSGDITNTVNVTYNNGFIAMMPVGDSFVTTVAGPYVVISKVAPPQAVGGDDIVYTLTVTNVGGDAAFNVWVNETYPVGVVFVSASQPVTVPDFAWLVGVLASGASWSVDITVNIIIGDGFLLNVATVEYTDAASTQLFTENDTALTLVGGPLIIASKNAPPTVNTGETFSYTISVTNVGNGTAINVYVMETYPAGVTYLVSSISDPLATLFGNNLWQIPILGPSETVVITINVQVNVNAAGNLHNAANISYGNGIIAWPGVDIYADTLVIDPSATLTKTAPDFANTGQLITYYLDYTVGGTDIAYNVWINETYPAGVTFVSSNIPASSAANNSWFLGDLVSGSSGTIEITVLVTAAAGTLTNTATLQFSNGWRRMPDLTATDSTTIRNPLLTFTKTAPVTAVAGQQITYILTVANTGDDWAYDVTVYEYLPLEVAFISSAPLRSGDYFWNLGTLAPGAVSIIWVTVSIDPTVSAGFTIWNNAELLPYGNAAGMSLPGVAATAPTNIIGPFVAIGKSGPGTATAGELVTYTINYANFGLADAYNVIITETYPADTTYIGSTNSDPTAIQIGTNVWFIPVLAAGAMGWINITVRFDAGPAITRINRVDVTYDNSAGVIGQPSFAEWQTLYQLPDMMFLKLGPSFANTGETVTYLIVYQNVGTADAHNVTITEAYSPGVFFVGSIPPPSVGNNVWHIGTVPAGVGGNIQITVQVIATGGWINNTAVLNYTTLPGIILPDETSNITTRVVNPLMELSKTAPAAAHRGDDITYSITYTNVGDDTAYNIVITETYPAGVTFISAIPPATIGNNVWVIPSMIPGASLTILITVHIDATAGTSITNIVDLTYDNFAAIPQPPLQATGTTAIGNPQMTIEKSGPAMASVGGNFDYSIYYFNSGDGEATNVVITESYPADVTFVGAIPAPINPGTGDNVWIIPSVPAGTGGWINITVNVNAGATLLHNWVFMNYSDSASAPQPMEQDDWWTGVSGPFIVVTKTGPSNANSNSVIMYTITVQNVGTEDANNVWVTETYPAFTSFFDANPAPTIGNNIWNVGTILAGATFTIFVNVSIQANAVGTIVNSVLVNYTNTAATPWPNSTVEWPTTIIDPNIIVQKTGPAFANPGQTITYTITVSNIGSAWAYNVVLNEMFDANVVFISCSLPGGTPWTIGMMSPNSTVVITVTVQILLGATGTIYNAVFVDYENAAGDAKPSSFAWFNTTLINPLLTITKSAPATANPGAMITYTITVRNVGTANAINVAVAETYPAGTIFLGASIAPEVGFDNLWLIPILTPGSTWIVTITMGIISTTTGTLFNTVTAQYSNEMGTVMPIVSANATTTLIAPYLQLVKSAPATANTGQFINYTITVTNTGTDTAYNVALFETYFIVVPLTVFVSSSPISPDAGFDDQWTLPFPLNPGESFVLQITVQVLETASGVILNQIEVLYTSAAFGIYYAFNTSTTAIVDPLFEVQKLAPATVNTGATMVYTIRYRNVGSDAAHNVVITENYPAGASFVSAIPAPTFPFDNVWNVGTVAADGAWHYINVTVSVSTTATGVLLNQVQVDYTDSNAQQQLPAQAWAFTAVVDPMVTLVKTAPQFANSNQTMTYTLRYWNNGTDDAYGVSVIETYPAWVTFVSAVPAPTIGNNVWAIGYLALGASGTITIIVRVSASVPSGTILHNVATVNYTDRHGEAQPVVQASADTTVRDPQIIVTKTGPIYANSGEAITYTITITNLGTDVARDVLVVETYDPLVNYVSYVSGDAPLFTAPNIWLYSLIPQGTTIILQITVTISPAAIDGDVIDNLVDVSYTDANGESQPRLQRAWETTIQDPIIVITKTGPFNSTAGAFMNYTITVTNLGSGTAYNLVITEAYPLDVTYVTSWPFPDIGFNTWIIPSLGGLGGSFTIIIMVEIDAGTMESVLINDVFANYTDLAGEPQPTEAASWPTALSGPFLEMTKQAPAIANPGQTITYYINITNFGLQAAYDVIVVETYPAGVTYLSAFPPPTMGSNIWQLGVIAAGATVMIIVNVTIDAAYRGFMTDTVTALYNNSANVPQQPVQASATTRVISPLMIVQKSGPTTATVGDTIMYVIHYENAGDDAAYNVVITETYPVGTTFVSSNPAPTIPNTVWVIPMVAAGEQGYIFINVSIQLNASTNRENSVQLDYENGAVLPQPPVWSNVTTQVPIPGMPLLQVAKSATATASIGQTIMYTITITNIGTANADNVVLTETYPPFTAFFDSSIAPTIPDTVWTWLSIAPGATETLFINVTVQAGASGILENMVSVAYDFMPSETARAATLIVGPQMAIEKTAPPMAGPSDNIVYTITYQNTGDDAATNVNITEVYPAGVSFFSSIPAPTIGNNVWIIPTVPAAGTGTITITVTVDAFALPGTTLTNWAFLNYTTVGAFQMPTESASATTIVTQVVMTITKLAPLSANPGTQMNYVISINNPSLLPATNVLVEEFYPVGVTYAASVPGIIPWDWNTPTQWFWATIPAGAGTSITITVDIDPLAVGTLRNRAQLNWTDNLANTFFLNATADTVVTGPMLQVTKAAPTLVSPGQFFTYSIVVRNVGPGVAANVVLRESYPAGITYVSATPGPSVGNYQWNLGSIAPGASRTIVITVRALPSSYGTVVNRIAVNYTALNGTALPTVRAQASTVIAGPSMVLAKSGPREVNPGQVFTYALTYGNIGQGTAHSVVVQDVLPAGVTYISSVPTGTLLGSTLTWNLGSVAGGASGTIVITVQATPAVSGDVLMNYGFLNYTNGVGRAQPTARAQPFPFVTIVTEPVILLTKTAPANANSGATIIYTITYQNTGNAGAMDVWINETYPLGVSFVSASPAPANPGAGDNIWYFPAVAKGATGIITIYVSVDPFAMDGDILANTVTADYYNQAIIKRPTVTAWANTTVADPFLVLQKFGVPTAPTVIIMPYLVRVTNFGSGDAYNVVVIDNLPAGVSFVDADVWPTAFNATSLTWIIPFIPAGTFWQVFIDVAVLPGVSGPVTNWANATYWDGSEEFQGSTGDWYTTIVGDPFINVVKTGPSQATPGETIMYAIWYWNNGTADAANVVINELYPVGTTYVNSSIPPDTPANDSWTIGGVPVGGSGVIYINVTIDPMATGQLWNTAVVTYEDIDGVFGYMAEANWVTDLVAPVIRVVKSAPATANTGETFTYTITVTNQGTGDAANVWVNDTYPAGITFVGAVPPATAGDNAWNIALIPSGTSVTITITVIVDNNAAGYLNNTVLVAFTNDMGLPFAPVGASASTLVIDPVVTITKWAVPVVDSGNNLVYYVNYTVSGTDSAYNVVITETYPAGVVFVSAVPAPTIGNNVWDLGLIGPGTSGSIAITVTMIAVSGVWMNNATATFTNGWRIMPPVSAFVNTSVRAPLLALTKAGPATAVTSQPISYWLNYTNSGFSNATGVTLTETYPAGVSFVSAFPAPSVGNNVWYLPDVPVNGTGSVMVNVTVNAAASGVLNNSAYINGSNNAGLNVTWDDAWLLTTIVDPALTIQKTGPTTANSGQTIVYTITVWNNGTSAAINVLLNDPLLGLVNVNIGPIPANGSWTSNYNYNVPIAATGWINNTATVDYENGFRAFVQVSDVHSVRIIDPQVAIVKAAPATANTGQTIMYTITVWNNGTSNAVGVSVTETYSASVTYQNANPLPTFGTTWLLGIIAPGASVTIFINVTVNVVAAGTVINNLAVLDHGNGFQNFSPMNAQATTTVVDPALAIRKTGPATANSGQTIIYTITIWNNGTSAATNVLLNDPLLGLVNVPVPNIAAGTSWTNTYNYVIPAAATGWIFNNATASYGNGFRAFTSVTDGHAVRLIDPRLTMVKIGPANATAGQNITYTIIVWNNGTSPAVGVVVTDPLIGINVTVGSILPGASWRGNYSYIVPGTAVGWINNTATARYGNGFRAFPPVSASASTVLLGNITLTINKTANLTAYAGGTITYVVRIHNTGTLTAFNLSLVEAYPAGVTFVGSVPVRSFGNNVWNFTNFSAGAWFNVTITVRVNNATAAGVLNNTVLLAYRNAAGIARPTLSAYARTTVLAPHMAVAKTGPANVGVGAFFNYTITYTNTGSGNAANLVVTETYPTGTVFVSAAPAPTAGNNVWNLGTLAPGASATITIRVRATIPGATMLNRVNLTYTNPMNVVFPYELATATTIAGSIDTPPRIYPDAPAVVYVGDLIVVMAEVTDIETGIDTVMIYWYNVDGTQGYGEMTAFAVNAQGNGDYTFTIPAQTFKGMVSLYIWANDTTRNENRTGWLDVLVILPPYMVWGDVLSNGGDLVPTALVLVTNDATNETTIGVTDMNGRYSVDLGLLYTGYQDGDQLSVFATDGSYYGFAHGNVSMSTHDDPLLDWPNRRIDVTLNRIPEFATVLAPVAIALLAFVVYRRRKRD